MKKNIGILMQKKFPRDNDKNPIAANTYQLRENLFTMVVENGHIPIPIQYEGSLVNEYLNIVDAIVLGGDGDIHPKFYGEKLKVVDDDMGLMADEKMEFQKSILDKVLVKKEKNIPILGICGGMQSINVAMGGSLFWDIADDVGTEVEHRNCDRPMNQVAHEIEVIDKNSFIYNTLHRDKFGVTTNHHQAIKKLAPNFKITAISPNDSVIEAIEYMGDVLCLGFQWHPERYATEEDRLLLKSFFEKV